VYEIIVLGLGVTALSAFIFLLTWLAVDEPIKEQQAVAAVLATAKTPVEATGLAASLLKAGDLYDYDETKDFLREVEKRGTLPSIKRPLAWYDDYVSIWLFWIWVSILVLVQLVVAYNLIYESRRRRQRIADLPWRKPWVWLFALATLVPGILYYPVSLFGVVRDRKNTPVKTEKTTEDQAGLLERVRRRNYFDHEPTLARIAYRRSRIGDRRRDLEEVRDQANKRIAHLTEKMRQWAEKLRAAQQEKGSQLALVRKTEQELEELVEGTPEEAKVEAEFDKLMALPCVVGVNAIGDTVNVLTYVTLEYGGETYFQGVWKISFDAKGGLSVCSEESGVKRKWHYGAHPDYRDHDGR